jgi:hypothetical protein
MATQTSDTRSEEIMSRPKIEAHDSLRDIMVKMSQGNPGGLSALIALVKRDEMQGFMRILSLDDMGMRGSQIWVAYKDHCKQDIEAFEKAIDARDPGMVATVNASRSHADSTPPAVTSGASFR